MPNCMLLLVMGSDPDVMNVSGLTYSKHIKTGDWNGQGTS